MASSGQRSNRTEQEKMNNNPLHLLMSSGQSVVHNTGMYESNDSQGSDTDERSQAYDWEHNVKAANTWLQSVGVEYLPIDKVGRVVEGRKTVSIYNVDKKGAKYFISYDGSDVYARIPELYMKDTLIYQLAALYISMMNNISHPEDADLETKCQAMKDGGFAIHIHPKAGSIAKRPHS
ncbi:uncharacterized protein PG998_009024 [Apiospora kogelbergensis]|uniref:uncharacterized protein n=1 Tax=Apiospora kogelbergensis TaxID=1337665 RepID=UPI003131B7ED